MQKVNRLGWTVGQTFLAYGERFGVRSNSLDVMRTLVSLLPPGTRECRSQKVERVFSVLHGGPSRGGPVKRFHIAYTNEMKFARDLDLETVYEKFESEVHLHVASVAQTRVFIHAGVVALNGKAILVPGRSQSGKSTLTLEFIKAGATFYSDEYAVLDSRGRVYPFPRPMQFRDGDGLMQKRVRADEVGAGTGLKPLPIGLILLTKFRSGASWRPQSIPSGRAVLKLLAHSVTTRNQPEASLKTVRVLASRAPVVSSPRGEAGEVVRWSKNFLY
jgi:hypothetical protein